MDGTPKQLVVERIKNATNILVTVSRNPSVDELAAALGLTLMLNKMEKHATAVFSGAIPPAISFLEPGKTFESTVNSLRDFIIALDKEKADRLRYKVEDDVVRIFITPYRTNITQEDLQFSQGDFNVELIIALGVDKRDDLDQAIAAHGRILHDATVVTVNADNRVSSLGSVDWSEGGASSLCEMLMSLSEALKPGLLDQQIATSLLTGIVAATDRFSNPQTSPKVMTMAAQLMAAGANQQLIAAKLEEAHIVTAVTSTESLEKIKGGQVPVEELPAQPPAPADGDMHIAHQEDVGDQPKPTMQTGGSLMPSPTTLPQPAPEPIAPPAHEAADPSISKAKITSWSGSTDEPPAMGGTLNATANEAEEARLAEERSNRNHTILKHDVEHESDNSMNAALQTTEPVIDPFASPLNYEETPLSETPPKVVQPITPQPEPNESFPLSSDDTKSSTIQDLERIAHESARPTPDIISSVDTARAAVDQALQSPDLLASLAQPVVPEQSPPAIQEPAASNPSLPFGGSLPQPPPMPDFSTLPPLPTEPPIPTFPQEEAVSTFPIQDTPSNIPSQPPSDTLPSGPGQFRIPGQ